MANFKPTITPEFLAHQKPKYGDIPLGKPVTVRFPGDIDAVLREKVGDRQNYIRKAVERQLREDGLIP